MTTHSAVSHSPTAPYPARAEQRDRCAREGRTMSGGDPVYSGRSAKGDVCAVYVRFIGIETECAGQE